MQKKKISSPQAIQHHRKNRNSNIQEVKKYNYSKNTNNTNPYPNKC